MPVSALFVEGKLDAEILGSIFSGTPAVDAKGSKHTLIHKARDERNRNNIRYLRDRDYDYLPPALTTEPIVDSTHSDGSILGWHWSHHEIESYLILPELVVAALRWNKAEYEAELMAAARKLRYYQLARWVIGAARRRLPPTKELATKPPGLDKDFDLPPDLSEVPILTWLNTHVHSYYKSIQLVLTHRNVGVAIQQRKFFFDQFPQNCNEAIAWCSGKNLMAGLSDWFAAKGIPHPAQFRIRMRDWIIAHPDEALALLPEWDRLLVYLRS